MLTRMARTVAATRHGNPGERLMLPAGILVALVPADNLPADADIKWWATPLVGQPVSQALRDWADGPGCGLYADDVALCRMPAVMQEGR